MNPKEVQQRIIAILTARAGGNAFLAQRLTAEIYDDPDPGLQAAALGTALFIADEFCGMLAKESETSKEEVIRRLALLIAERDS